MITEPQKDFIVLGALGFSGVAYKKWMSILSQITIKDLNEIYLMSSGDPFVFKDKLLCIFKDSVLINTIVSEWGFFAKDIDYIINNFHLIDSYGMSSDRFSIRFTGFRNQQLVEQLTNMGFDADDSGVTKNTNLLLIPYSGFESSKVQKAKKYGVPIVQVTEFINSSEKYIGVKLDN